MKHSNLLVAGLSGIYLFAGCAHFPENELLSYEQVKGVPERGYVYQGWDNGADDLLVAVALSGGGARAAAFSFGVIEELHESVIHWNGSNRRLLHEVDLVSSVSGGSITAAYWAAHGQEKLLREYPVQFLDHHVKRDLLLRFLSPVTNLRLLGQKFERVDVMAEYMDDQLFNEKTFADIRGNKPFFLINATDISSGTRFGFTQEHFDQLCSNLDTYSLSRAVAASSAVPGASSPVTLRNHDENYCKEVRKPKWVSSVLDSEDGANSPSLPQLRRARAVRNYRDKTKIDWVHLFDGGVADNLGLRGIYDVAFAADRDCTDAEMQRVRNLRGIVVIVVDAMLDLTHEADRKINGPTFRDSLAAGVSIPIDRLSEHTFELLRPQVARWIKKCGGDLQKIEVHPILVRITDVPDPDRKLQVSTKPYPVAESSALLRQAGREALRSNRQFNCLRSIDRNRDAYATDFGSPDCQRETQDTSHLDESP